MLGVRDRVPLPAWCGPGNDNLYRLLKLAVNELHRVQGHGPSPQSSLGPRVICEEHNALLKEEDRAWAAYNDLRNAGSKDKEEMLRRADAASLVSSRLREHIASCPVCCPKP